MQKISGYKEVYRAYDKLKQLMEAIRLPEAVELADALRLSGTRDKNIWWALLAAYIDGGEAERAFAGAEAAGAREKMLKGLRQLTGQAGRKATALQSR